MSTHTPAQFPFFSGSTGIGPPLRRRSNPLATPHAGRAPSLRQAAGRADRGPESPRHHLTSCWQELLHRHMSTLAKALAMATSRAAPPFLLSNNIWIKL